MNWKRSCTKTLKMSGEKGQHEDAHYNSYYRDYTICNNGLFCNFCLNAFYVVVKSYHPSRIFLGNENHNKVTDKDE